MTRLGLFLIGGLLAATPLLAGDLTISEPWARASIGVSRPGAAYLTIANGGAEADRLIAVETPAAAMPMVHVTAVDAAGVARMEHAPGLEIPAGGSVTLAPGGAHVMLMQLAAPLVEGETLPLTLRFERAGAVEVEAPILAITARGPKG